MGSLGAPGAPSTTPPKLRPPPSPALLRVTATLASLPEPASPRAGSQLRDQPPQRLFLIEDGDYRASTSPRAVTAAPPLGRMCGALGWVKGQFTGAQASASTTLPGDQVLDSEVGRGALPRKGHGEGQRPTLTGPRA